MVFLERSSHKPKYIHVRKPIGGWVDLHTFELCVVFRRCRKIAVPLKAFNKVHKDRVLIVWLVTVRMDDVCIRVRICRRLFGNLKIRYLSIITLE